MMNLIRGLLDWLPEDGGEGECPPNSERINTSELRPGDRFYSADSPSLGDVFLICENVHPPWVNAPPGYVLAVSAATGGFWLMRAGADFVYRIKRE